MVHHFASMGTGGSPDRCAGGTGVRAAASGGLWDALDDLGLPRDESLVVTGDLSADGGAEAAPGCSCRIRRPRSGMQRPDGARRDEQIAARGLRVGDDVAVAGFDDIPAAVTVPPAPPSASRFTRSDEVAQTLIRLIRGETVQNLHVLLEPSWSSAPQAGGHAAVNKEDALSNGYSEVPGFCVE